MTCVAYFPKTRRMIADRAALVPGDYQLAELQKIEVIATDDVPLYMGVSGPSAIIFSELRKWLTPTRIASIYALMRSDDCAAESHIVCHTLSREFAPPGCSILLACDYGCLMYDAAIANSPWQLVGLDTHAIAIGSGATEVEILHRLLMLRGVADPDVDAMASWSNRCTFSRMQYGLDVASDGIITTIFPDR